MLVGLQEDTDTLEGSLVVSYKTSLFTICLPYDQQSCSYGMFSKDPEAYFHTESLIQMFIVALFIITKLKNNQGVLQ